jgi:lysophospholipase L1-like esterase
MSDTRRVTRTTFIATLLLALAMPAGSAGAAGIGPYVSLGDSYTSAPLVPNQVGTPSGCARSDHNYPSLVAAAIGATSFRDVSCSGAKTSDMTAPQAVPSGTNPPQLDAVSSDTQLVTIGIGGNDEGLVEVATTCAQLGLLAPTGTACRDRFAPGGDDAIVARIAATAPKIAAVLQGIRERAPAARIVVVGYPGVLPRSGNGCYPLVPFSGDDIRYFDGLIVQTNEMLAEQAVANGAEFADTYLDSAGHDICTLPGTKWFEGLVPTAVALPLHPNALGMQSMARSVTAVVDRPRPGPVLGPLVNGRRSIARGRPARFGFRLDRPATVAVVIERVEGGRRRGAACQKPSRANRRGHACQRTVVIGRMGALGRAGENTLTVDAPAYGRRAGLYRLTATPVSDDIEGAPQVAQFRVKR